MKTERLNLRPYQKECIGSIIKTLKEKDTHLTVLPTGTGKTETFVGLIDMVISLKDDFRCILVMDREKLVKQAYERIVKYMGDDLVGIYCGSMGRRDDAQILVATRQSLINTIEYEKPHLLIIDEVHELDCSNEESQFMKIIKRFGTKVCGFTATPFRDSGYIYGEGKFFNKIDFTKSLSWAIENKYLVPIKSKGVNNIADLEGVKKKGGEFVLSDLIKRTNNDALVERQVEEALVRAEGRKKIAWMCVNIEHAEMVRKLLPESSLIHSKKKLNDLDIEMFERGPHRHMVSVAMLTKGYDYPPIDCIVCLRPTRSPSLYVQIAGRGLRPSEGKEDCLFIDFGEVVKTLGPIDDPIVEEKMKGVASLVKMCASCGGLVRVQKRECDQCGYEFHIDTIIRDPYANLTKKSDYESDIMGACGEGKWKVRVTDSQVKWHEAKSGRKCLKIWFKTSSNKYKWFSEYLQFEGPGRRFAVAIFKTYCYGAPPVNNTEAFERLKQRKIPKHLVLDISMAYPKIFKKIF